MGLFPTLRWHFGQFTAHTGIQVEFLCENEDRRFAAGTEIAAFRIIQEALTNVARHAHVTKVAVAISEDADSLRIGVFDTGKGFSPGVASEKASLGLSGMRERAELLGGSLRIETGPGKGTRVQAALPLADKPLERRKAERIDSAG
jgi:signal transduction histidine kinase